MLVKRAQFAVDGEHFFCEAGGVGLVFGGDADVAAWGEAPVVGFYFVNADEFDEAGDVAQGGFWETFGKF